MLLCISRTQVAVYKGTGSTDDADNFECGANPAGADTEDCNARMNQRLFGEPFVPSAPCPGCPHSPAASTAETPQ